MPAKKQRDILPDFQFIQHETRMVAAVSGGADSMAMLHLLVERGFQPAVAHFDHRIRAESGQDAEIVHQTASNLGLDFFLGSGDVLSEAARQKTGIEETARQMRYRYLFSVCAQINASVLLVAHTLDDQVETVLMHLLRGSGLDGLRGMRQWSADVFPDQPVPIYRPLLDWPRKEVERYCQSRGIRYCSDQSNNDLSFFRNKMRLELLPLLDALNPASRRNIARLARIAGEEVGLLERLTGALWEKSVVSASPQALSIDLNGFNASDPVLRRRLLRKAAQTLLRDERDIDSQLVSRLETFCAHGTRSGQIEVNDRLLARIHQHQLNVFLRDFPPESDWIAIESREQVSLPVPGVVKLANGWSVSAEFAAVDHLVDTAPSSRLIWQAALDADTISAGLLIRPWQRGERYRPLGLSGHSKKISDLFIDAKIPSTARGMWPVISCGGEIVWVPGFPPAYANRVTQATDRVVLLTAGRFDN